MRYRSKVDMTHKTIVDGLRQAGYSVQSLAGVGQGFFDLVVGGRLGSMLITRAGHVIDWTTAGNVLLEVKTPARVKAELRRKDRQKQREVQAEWQGAKATVTSLDEALKVLRGEG